MQTTPKYLLVEKHIKKAIKKQEIVDKLPGERTLAKELGFSYMTIRKAIDNLVAEGVLYKVPTKGTFVADKKKPKKATHTIGYFLDSSITGGLSSPYYSMIFNALEHYAAKHGYLLTYFSDGDDKKLKKNVAKMDGVIATCFPRIEHVIQKIKDIAPVVVIDNSSSDKTIPSVIIDNFNAVRDSVDYLVNLGHRRIAFMTGLEDSDVGRDRRAGYEAGLLKNDILVDTNLEFRGNFTFKSGLHGTDYFLSLPEAPTAILCANDSMALGSLRKLVGEGIKVPEQISVMGFDDIEVAAQIVPALTTVKAPVEAIAETSVCMLDHLIKGKTLDNKHMALTAKLVIRHTCAEIDKVKAAQV